MTEFYSPEYTQEQAPAPTVAEVPTKERVLATVGLILEAVKGTDKGIVEELIDSRMPEVIIAGLIAFARATEDLPGISPTYSKGAADKANKMIRELIQPPLNPEDYYEERLG